MRTHVPRDFSPSASALGGAFEASNELASVCLAKGDRCASSHEREPENDARRRDERVCAQNLVNENELFRGSAATAGVVTLSMSTISNPNRTSAGESRPRTMSLVRFPPACRVTTRALPPSVSNASRVERATVLLAGEGPREDSQGAGEDASSPVLPGSL